jgi:hypothetical protein
MANRQALKFVDLTLRYKHICPVPRMTNFAPGSKAWI